MTAESHVMDLTTRSRGPRTAEPSPVLSGRIEGHPSNFTAEQIEGGIGEALREGNLRVVPVLLRLLAEASPRAAGQGTGR